MVLIMVGTRSGLVAFSVIFADNVHVRCDIFFLVNELGRLSNAFIQVVELSKDNKKARKNDN